MRKQSLMLAVATAIALLAVPAPALAQDLEDVLAKHYEAIGGVDAWEGITSTRMEGTLAIDAMGMAMDGPFKLVQKSPAMSRAEFTIQGMSGVMAYDGEMGWQINPLAGIATATPVGEAERRQMAEQADIAGPLFNWKEKGHAVELLGTEDVAGTTAYKLKLTVATGEESFYYIDTDSYRAIQTVATRDIQGAPTQITTHFEDYKEVGGLVMPHTIEVTNPMFSQTITFTSIEVNPTIDDAVFVMPEK